MGERADVTLLACCLKTSGRHAALEPGLGLTLYKYDSRVPWIYVWSVVCQPY